MNSAFELMPVGLQGTEPCEWYVRVYKCSGKYDDPTPHCRLKGPEKARVLIGVFSAGGSICVELM